MDPRLLRYYERELQHLRETAGEFADAYPKIAARLSLSGLECADPYVERLLEGVAFLSARIQLKLDAQFPAFTQHLLEMIYPHYLAPTPSMLVARFDPDPGVMSLVDGFALGRDTVMRSQMGRGDRTACEYRTAHAITLWPLQVAEAEYMLNPAARLAAGWPSSGPAPAALRLVLRGLGQAQPARMGIDRLPLYLCASGPLPFRLYEQLLAHCVAVGVRPVASGTRGVGEIRWLAPGALRPMGFADDQALLPVVRRSFQGYRVLAEYFSFPERYLFVELNGLQPALGQCPGAAVEVVCLFGQADRALEGAVGAEHVLLNCAPAVNLFPRRTDRIHLGEHAFEHHVVPDRTRPQDFEIYRIERVQGHGSGSGDGQPFLPFYADFDRPHERGERYYTMRRVPRLPTARERRYGSRSSYVGSEVFLSLVDAGAAPYSTEMQQLAVNALCTNRDLPLQLSLGASVTDFSLESGAPVSAVRCVSGPTRPRASPAFGDTAWRLVSHLSLNYLSLVDSDRAEGAEALRQMLRLYAGEPPDAVTLRQIDGLVSIGARPVTRRVPLPGPLAFGRGLALTLECDDSAFEGGGSYLMAAVLEHFLAQYVQINSFTETTLRTVQRGEVRRWPVRMGCRTML